MSEDLNQEVLPVESTKTSSVSNQKEESTVTHLTDKDIKWRAKYKESISELETLKAAQDRKEKELSEKLSSAEKQMNAAITKRIDAELKALAVNAGLTDLDLIKLMDKEKISVDTNGDPMGIEEVVNAFKQAKPAYFTEPKKTSSSTNVDRVKPSEPVSVDVFAMDSKTFEAEFQKNFGR